MADADADGVPVRVYRPTGRAAGALVYFHGGGWVVGSLDSHDRLCRTLAARAGATVVSVGYRLAPEHPFPAAVEDAWTATCWSAERYRPLALGGDSAGGHLSAVTALRARDRGLPVALQVLVYPVTDRSFDTASYREHGTGLNLTERTMRWFWEQFVHDDPPPGAEHEVSPLRATDVGGVAPALVLTAECDPLRDEGEAYANRLSQAGVPTTLTRYDGTDPRLPQHACRPRGGRPRDRRGRGGASLGAYPTCGGGGIRMRVNTVRRRLEEGSASSERW